MNKLPASLCEELGLTGECISKVNDYMEKAINEAIERSKKITIKVKIGTYENACKIERELVFDKNDKLEELCRKVNDLLEEEGCELYLGIDLSYSYNGEQIWMSEDAEGYYNEIATLESHFKVDGVLEIVCLDLGDE